MRLSFVFVEMKLIDFLDNKSITKQVNILKPKNSLLVAPLPFLSADNKTVLREIWTLQAETLVQNQIIINEDV